MTSGSNDSRPERFSVVKRGYAPSEVDDRIARLEQTLRATTQEHDEAHQQLAERHAELNKAQKQLASAQAEVDGLRSELDRQAAEPLTMSGLSARMQRLIQIAEEECAEMRAASDQYSTDVRAAADKEADQTRREADDDAANMRADVRDEVASMRAEADAQVTRAQAEIADDRAEMDRTRTEVYDQAKRLMTEAHADAEQTLTDARSQAEQLSAAAAADRAKQQEDYEMATEARRRQAHRAVTELEESSRADAAHRIEQANTHARNVVESANEHAEELLKRTAEESHTRVSEADAAVRKLVTLRAELQQQILDLTGHLSDVTDVMTRVRKTLEPLPLESGRPREEDFPAEPGTVAEPAMTTVEAAQTNWHPPAPPVSLAWEGVSGQLDNGDGAGVNDAADASSDGLAEGDSDGLADADMDADSHAGGS